MELYTQTSYQLSRQLTLNYSTSFSKSSKLFSKDIQHHIFAIYGLVRIADEVVDTYDGGNKAAVLAALEKETYSAIKTGYSTNPIVHAFAQTAIVYNFNTQYIEAFFESMRMDLRAIRYTQSTYQQYIYGSAEVIGLLCLQVFCANDTAAFKRLQAEAKALGSAYQKVNFLRDFGSDFTQRKRVYFPGVSYGSFDEKTKLGIIKDIKNDFKKAQPALKKLPQSAQKAVSLSYLYYQALLHKLEATPAEQIKAGRVRISDIAKTKLFIKHSLQGGKK